MIVLDNLYLNFSCPSWLNFGKTQRAFPPLSVSVYQQHKIIHCVGIMSVLINAYLINLWELSIYIIITWASLVAQTVKRLPTMRETRVWSLGWEDLLEKAMATHSSTLAWKIPWTKEPGRLQSTGSQRIGHNWATLLLHFIITAKPLLSTYQISVSSLVFPLCLVLSFLSLIISDILDIPTMLTQFLFGLVLLIWKLFNSSAWVFLWQDVFIL